MTKTHHKDSFAAFSELSNCDLLQRTDLAFWGSHDKKSWVRIGPAILGPDGRHMPAPDGIGGYRYLVLAGPDYQSSSGNP